MNLLTRAAASLALALSAGYASAADVTEHQWVRATNGAVKGRVVVPRSDSISAVRGAKVHLLDQRGNLATGEVKSDNTGRFTMTGVKPGLYTLVIQGEHSFACCAMHVVDSIVPLKDQFEVAAGAVDADVVRGLMVRYLPNGESKGEIAFDPATNPLTLADSVAGESIRIRQTDGGLKGRLGRPGFAKELGASASNVMIYKEGAEVARTTTDAKGNFSVAKLAPGSYTVIGSGPDGFGVMGVELVDPNLVETAAGQAGESTFVAAAMLQETFIMQVAPVTSEEVVSDVVVTEEYYVEDDDRGGAIFGGGGMSGGGGAGGGGIGGGGGLGRLGVLGGIGAAIAIAASDDDDSVTPPVASPSVPASN
ncbi:hypothetical protein U8335_20165 [Roseiconus lacunae]|uniref:hypothetical protein n=1 Tax=Roseiconus lacunae TaxID=2605694 RepID=UPI001E453EEA|nr:hypothetical protein [Roseiconus lacunae]MCD0458952.1 hypothetical protein [Roseiconus lacunae]WRQ49262.1 hypothetical protein U8335_20165 [Stieleria sp. HD01]